MLEIEINSLIESLKKFKEKNLKEIEEKEMIRNDNAKRAFLYLMRKKIKSLENELEKAQKNPFKFAIKQTILNFRRRFLNKHNI